MSEQHKGSAWLKRQYKQLVVSDLGCHVADVLGEVFSGLYHLDDTALFHKRTDWNNTMYIEVVTRGRLTHSHLIMLVEQCRQHNIHVEIEGASNGYVRLLFFSEI